MPKGPVSDATSAHLRLAGRVLAAARGRKVAAGRVGPLPSARDVDELVNECLEVLFPGAGRIHAPPDRSPESLRRLLAAALGRLGARLEGAVYLGLHRRCREDGVKREDGCRARARRIAARVLDALPSIRERLALDVEAAFDADPAATGTDEIIACYPGLYAIATYRVAHRLLGEGAEIIPRMMTENAHSRTGIDIHPGASIGEPFFIDHGTGIVIGETTVIGNRVRVYQGVTLGALSVRHRAPGAPPPGRARRRHPTIEDDVIIYANATILGGETVIGRGAVVGGNAWITYSVPPGVRVGVGT